MSSSIYMRTFSTGSERYSVVDTPPKKWWSSSAGVTIPSIRKNIKKSSKPPIRSYVIRFSNKSCTTQYKSHEKTTEHSQTHLYCMYQWYPKVGGRFIVFLMIKSRKNNNSTIIYQWSLHQQGSSGEIFGTASHQLKPSHVALKVSLAAHSSSGLPPVPERIPSPERMDETFQQMESIPLRTTYLPKTLKPKPVNVMTCKPFANHGCPQSTGHLQIVHHLQKHVPTISIFYGAFSLGRINYNNSQTWKTSSCLAIISPIPSILLLVKKCLLYQPIIPSCKTIAWNRYLNPPAINLEKTSKQKKHGFLMVSFQ